MNKEYFDLAFIEAEKAFNNNEVPIGAVIVKDGIVIASAYNHKEEDMCATSHAEILAIQEASKKLNNWRLDGCSIYVTLDPCPMCASAIKQARISHVYSALNNSDPNNLFILENIFKTDNVNPMVEFESNLDSERSKELLNSFFEKQRN
ncbi:MAG: nucleoside deaminase [Bacilli bacterium]|nr:nucleoside deaminase [Bacilli bacterium]